MVRANAASLAATSTAAAADKDTSPSPASRVAELGEHIDATLKIHEPAATAERLTVPFTEETKCRAFVFIRKITEDESTDDAFEAAVALNGSIIESGVYLDLRRDAIKTILTTLYYHIARQSSAHMKAAARELNKIVKDIADLPEGVDLPAGTACEWPLKIDDEEEETINEDGDVECAADEAPTDESTDAESVDELFAPPATDAAVEIPAIAVSPDYAAAVAGEACGERGVDAVAEPVAPPVIIDEAAERAEAERIFKGQVEAANQRHSQASLARFNLEQELKRAKTREKSALEDLSDILDAGPNYYRPMRTSAVTTGSTTPTTTAPAFPSHDPLPPPDAEHNPTSPQAGEPQANAPTTTAVTVEQRDWQSADIDELGLPPKLAERLREAGCPTIGKLEALRGSFDGLMSISGIGRGKADQIEEALLGWLSKNRDASTLSAAREAAVAGEGVALEMAAQAQ